MFIGVMKEDKIKIKKDDNNCFHCFLEKQYF